MILRKEHKVLVQGITGKQGVFWTEHMQAYGTQVVGGVNPRRAGELSCGVPVYASAKEAVAASGKIDLSVMFIPPAAALDAALDVIEAGIGLLVILTEHIPMQDVLRIHDAAGRHGTRIYGPNTAGVVTPGEAFAGIMPAFNDRVFKPGRIGVISRSGSLGTLVCLNLTSAGLGQSAFLGVGGDPMVGISSAQALQALADDEHTDAIVLVGEIGGVMEEEAAEVIKRTDKPVVSFIAGRASPPGKKMGHAGAIVMGNRGSYKSKRSHLEEAGATVVDTPGEIATTIAECII